MTEETEKDTNKCKNILYSWIGRIGIVKCLKYPKQSIGSI